MSVQNLPEKKTLPDPYAEIASLLAGLQDIIADTDDEMLAPLTEALKPMEIKLLKPPAAGLIMMTVKSGHGTVFHLGEVLVTEAQVSCGESIGYGCCMGERFDGAIVLASLDAMKRAACPMDLEAVKSAIEKVCQTVFQKRETEAQMTAITLVDFRSMAEE